MAKARTASRVAKPALALLAALVLQTPARTEDKPAKPADGAQLQSTLIAVGHLSVHRPECLVAILAATVRRGPMTSAEFRDLDLPVQGAVAATGIVGVKNALVDVALLRHAANNGFWIVDEPSSVLRRVREPELDKGLLVGIEDGRKIPTFDENPHEYRSYIYVISHAHDVPLAAMQQAAKPAVEYVHLLEDPSRHRGEIIHISGTLVQLRSHRAPSSLLNDGIREFHEGLIISDISPAIRYWVAFTEKPPEIKQGKPGEKLDYPVSCYAYFFKRTYLDVKDARPVRAPLVVARTVVLQKVPPAVASSDPTIFPGIPVVFVVIGLTLAAVLVFCLLLWFRKGDRAVQSRLAGARNTKWVPPPEENGIVGEAGRTPQGQEPQQN